MTNQLSVVSLRTKFSLLQQTKTEELDLYALISQYFDFDNATSKILLPQHLASSEGHLPIVEFLLDSRADVLHRYNSLVNVRTDILPNFEIKFLIRHISEIAMAEQL